MKSLFAKTDNSIFLFSFEMESLLTIFIQSFCIIDQAQVPTVFINTKPECVF